MAKAFAESDFIDTSLLPELARGHHENILSCFLISHINRMRF